MRIGLCQINTTVGDFAGNRARIERAVADARRRGAQLAIVPELAICGYPPEDLLLRQAFLADHDRCLAELAANLPPDIAVLVGCVERNERVERGGRQLHNAVALIDDGIARIVARKSLLPTYDIFDESRYFEPWREPQRNLVRVAGRTLGVVVCEDGWNDPVFFRERLYPLDPVQCVVDAGAEIVVNLSASPWDAGKDRLRREMVRAAAKRHGLPVVYVNQVGGNDELLFDGSSIVFDANGQTIFCARAFEEHATLVQLQGSPCEMVAALTPDEEIGQALVMGLRDYIRKCGFKDVVIGLSGGIDSAVTAAIAVEALGKEHVTGIAMPSQFSSRGSLDDACALARNLGIAIHVVPIESVYKTYEESLNRLFNNNTFDTANENVQARIRGNILMAWSNRTGAMVVSTGNKSEMAVGYCTLYGDMAGGLALLGDVYKTTIYRVANWINRDREIIPRSTITKPPSAELKPNQTDQDTLPPYEVLDGILKLYIEDWYEVDQIAAAGFDRALVEKTLRMVDTNEFKRRQAAPTIRVSEKAFGSGRQMPIAQRWRREPARFVR